MKQKPDNLDFWAETLQPAAMAALERLIECERTVKTKKQTLIKNGKPTGYYKITTTTSTRPPNVAAVIFAMERLFPECFAKRFSQIPEIKTVFQTGLERPHGLTFSLGATMPHKVLFPLTAKLSPTVKAVRDLETNHFLPILKAF